MAESPTSPVKDEELFVLHSGGNTPPLADSKDPRLGLVNGKLLEIYQCGYSGVHSTPLGILLADHASKDAKNRWLNGNYHYNELTKQYWTNFCNTVRGFTTNDHEKSGNIACEKCDREQALLAENSNKAIAYLCCHGMIDFAVPVKVGHRTMAVLFTGQLRPSEKYEWPTDLVSISRVEGEPPRADKGISVLSNERIARVVSKYGIPQEDIDRCFKEDNQARSTTEVTPEKVSSILKEIDNAASLLSNLATNTYNLQKLRLSSLIRFDFAHALAVVNDKLTNIDDGLQKMNEALVKFSNLVDLEYAAVCRLKTEKESVFTIEVISQVGLDKICHDRKSFKISDLSKNLLFSDQQSQRAFEISSRTMALFTDKPFFRDIFAKHNRAAEGNPTLLCAACAQVKISL